MKARLISLTFLFCAYALTSCQSKNGSEFVGTWDSITPGSPGRITITTNGDNYLAEIDHKNAGATYKDGILTIAGHAEITYVKSSDHIIVNNFYFGTTAEFARAKSEERPRQEKRTMSADAPKLFDTTAELARTKSEERPNQEKRTMLADAPKLLVGTWRWQNSTTTYDANGIAFVRYNDGETEKYHWAIEGDLQTMTRIERNGKRDENAPESFRIITISSAKFVTMGLRDNKEWTAERVK